MTAPASSTVGAVSEAAVLDVVLTALRGSSQALVGPGDDAAVLAVPGERVVVTTDTLVHGPDFRLAWSSPRDLGAKAAAVNLADVAAMGARPTALFVALTLPPATSLDFVADLAAGLREACELLAPGCAVEGGDLTVSDTLTLAVTAVGVLDGRAPVLRSGARPGEVVAVSGELGAAARGLALLFERFTDAGGDPVVVDATGLTAAERADLAAQLRPQPPVRLGPIAAEGGATAMMDVSDGLLLDAGRLARASEVTIALEGTWSDAALRGGEDHALLATFPAGALLPDGFRAIGHVVAAGESPVTVSGAPDAGPGGWDPYRDWDDRRG